MRKIEPEFITGMGYIGASPGVLYRMGGAGEQTVVTGNPALLDGVKGSRFTSLTLCGKSTQVRTTGAQLNDGNISNLIGSIEGVIISSNKYASIIIPIQGGEDYTISYTTHKAITFHCTTEEYPAEGVAIVDVYSGSSGVEVPKKIMHTSSRAKYLVVNVDVNDSELLKNAMLNSGSAALPFEPYTGGAPSPSPSYPQEIESAGQDGAIGIEALGKNLIPFPYPLLGGAGTQIERNGVKYTVQSDGGIRCVGTPTAIDTIGLTDIRFSEINMGANTPTNGKIVLSGEKIAYDMRNSKLFIYIELDHVGKPIDTVIYPQIELGTVATSYEPYKPAQKLVIPTPGGLPGIPVSSGGNYTDKDGQQWVCDEIDLANGEKVQRCKRDMFILRKSDNRYITGGILGVSTNYSNVICDKFAYNPDANNGSPGIRSSGNYNSIVAWCENFEEASSTIEVDVTYVLATPIRTPLPPETIAAYKKLHTYSPTTTVINDAGAGMIVGYKKVRLRKCGKE